MIFFLVGSVIRILADVVEMRRNQCVDVIANGVEHFLRERLQLGLGGVSGYHATIISCAQHPVKGAQANRYKGLRASLSHGVPYLVCWHKGA